MKHLFFLVVAAGLVITPAQALPLRADEGAQNAPSDPNFRWHQGHWWYWQANQKRWLIWQNDQWRPQPLQQTQRSRTVRRYSYSPEAASGSVGVPSRSRSSGGRIHGSFGNRPAAAKTHGNY